MKRILVFLSFSLLVGHLHSQQMPHYSLYMMNPFIYNPGIAGTANYYQIRSNHRFQWAGFNGAPVTNAISAFGPHRKKDMGFGTTLYNDVTGPLSTTGLNGVYAYNISATTDIRLSFGIMLGIKQFKIDGTKITLHDDFDMALLPTVNSRFIPDASLGIYGYSSNLYFGFSAAQLLNNSVTKSFNDLNGNELGLNKLKSHFYLMGGYIFDINREWDVEPGMVISKEIASPFQLEVYCKGIFKNMLWGALSFRTADAATAVFGYTHEKKIFFGYSFDFAINDIRKYSYGSHEIFIGFNFDKIKKISRRK